MPARTLARELRSMWRSSTRPGSRISERAVLPHSISRTVQYVVAPVAAIARAVSTPIPEEQPVMRKVLSCSLPSRPSSFMIWRAVGRALPGPWGFWCGAAYLEAMMDKEE